MSEPEVPAALPPVGGTTPAERTDPRVPDASGTVFSIQEAAKRYTVSVATLRRLLEPGGPGIAGAYKEPGPKGERWMIPTASLRALGYVPLEEQAAEVLKSEQAAEPAPTLGAEVLAEMRATREMLVDLYRSGQARLEAAEQDRTDARREAAEMAGRLAELEARYAAELAAANARAEVLAEELERARVSRGLFRRRR